MDERQVWGCIFPQATIGDYRVDFLILYAGAQPGFGYGIEREGLGGVIVECDGHDFHERTREQAARDKARDRALQEAGYKVLRFTGSEIWRDVVGCADQALRIVYDAAFVSMLNNLTWADSAKTDRA